MELLTLGKNRINTARIVNVITPARKQHVDLTRPNQGICENAVVFVLAGAPDLVLFDEDAEAAREWLAKSSTSAVKAEPEKITVKSVAPAVATPGK